MSNWDTYDELSFIDGLGTGSHYNPGSHAVRQFPVEARLNYLRGYQQSLSLRRIWTGLDQRKIEQHVAALIAKLSNPQPKESK